MMGASTNADAQKISIQGQMMRDYGPGLWVPGSGTAEYICSKQSKYQAGVADINKEIAKANAIYSRDVGEVEAQQAGMKAHSDMGEMIAQQGASGLEC